jgi:hypothetical protein
MAYEGEVLNYCPDQMFDFSDTYVVIVSGAKLNPYGHMLLNTGGKSGSFFQVSDVYGFPRFMNADQFQRYLKENNKSIVTVFPVKITDPEKAEAKLEEVLSRKWAWAVVFHNCEGLVEEIVMAGGGPKLHQGMLLLPMHSANRCRDW